MSRGLGKAGMGLKEGGVVLSALPPEEDPLLAGLQGVDTVIEHFIKNAQGEAMTPFGSFCVSLCLSHDSYFALPLICIVKFITKYFNGVPTIFVGLIHAFRIHPKIKEALFVE